MKYLYKLIFISYFILGSNYVFSKGFNNYEIHNDLENNKIEINSIIKKAIDDTYHHWEFKVRKINFNIKDQKLNVREMGFSNADYNSCKIELLINQDDFKDESYIYFSIVHEIAHCYIGKEVFLSPNFNWKISSIKNDVYQKYIDSKTLELMSNSFKIGEIHPLMIYHEIAADIFALNWINDKDLTLKIYEIRLEDWDNNLTETKHASHWSIKGMIEKRYISKDLNVEYGFKKYMDQMIKSN